MTVNPKQIRILIGAVVIFAGMGLFPPWTYTFDAPSIHRVKPAGYKLIVAPPNSEHEDSRCGVQLDFLRLLIQWIVLSAATGGLFLLTKEPDSK